MSIARLRCLSPLARRLSTYPMTLHLGIASSTNAGLPSAFIEPVKVAVLGAGAFGTAMAQISARQGHQVSFYSRNASQVAAINETHHNPQFFPEFELLPSIVATDSVQEACDGATLVIVCIPAQATPDFLAEHKDDIPEDAILVITSKGLYLKTKQLLSEPIMAAMGRDQPLTFLSGPSFALELMKNAPSAVVVASRQLYHAVKVQRLLSTVDFRIYSSQDIIGVQLGGALKNPLAIGAGMIEGSGLGINTLAAYVTRSSLELQKLCIAMGGQPHTISGLSGIGDLMLTAFGSLSRNRTCGIRLINGEKKEDILATTTVEGVPTAEVAVYFAGQCGLDLPIFRTVNDMIQGHVNREDLQNILMNRPLKSESTKDFTMSCPSCPMSPRTVVQSGALGVTQLLDRNKQWANAMRAKDPNFFLKLAEQQTPEILWIGCSDSRVPANEILKLPPGEVFVHRNIANQVISTDLNCLSVIEYAVKFLRVKHIIVCGHYGCGGVNAALSQQEFGIVDNWLRSIKDLYIENARKFLDIADPNVKSDLLIEENVARSVYNICHTRILQRAWEQGQEINVHGWCYRLKDGIIRDLNICISSADQVEAIYRRMMDKKTPEN